MRFQALGLALALVGPGLQQDERPFRDKYPKDGVTWALDWTEALYESRWRNVPMHVAYHDDSEPSRSMIATVYSDPKFIEASRMWVNVPVLAKGGHEVDVDRDGGRVILCDRFWNINCEVHVRHAAAAVNFKDLTQRPATVFTMMGLQELGRLEGKITAPELLKAQEKVVAAWGGARVPQSVWKDVRELRDEGNQFFKLKEWRKTIDAYLKIKKPKYKTLVELGDDLLKQVNQEGELIYADAYKVSEDPKRREEAKKALRKIVKDFSPLMVSKKAQDTLDKLH